MRPRSRRFAAVVGCVVLVGVLGACSSGGSSIGSWNEERIDAGGFDRAANRRALGVLDRIEKAGLECSGRQTESWGAIAGPYDKVDLQIPLGSASCTGPGGENLLVEVFRRDGYPSGEDFMQRKTRADLREGHQAGPVARRRQRLRGGGLRALGGRVLGDRARFGAGQPRSGEGAGPQGPQRLRRDEGPEEVRLTGSGPPASGRLTPRASWPMPRRDRPTEPRDTRRTVLRPAGARRTPPGCRCRPVHTPG